jgi:hypothetical protein
VTVTPTDPARRHLAADNRRRGYHRDTAPSAT